MKYPPITLKLLRSKEACSKQVILFKKYFGAKPVPLNKRIFTKFVSKFDLDWAADHLLDSTDSVEYDTVVLGAALAEYDKVCDACYAKLEKLTNLAYAKYNKINDTIHAECKNVKETALTRTKFNKVRNTAYAEYTKVKATAWLEYDKVSADALAEYRNVKVLTFLKLYTAK